MRQWAILRRPSQTVNALEAERTTESRAVDGERIVRRRREDEVTRVEGWGGATFEDSDI